MAKIKNLLREKVAEQTDAEALDNIELFPTWRPDATASLYVQVVADDSGTIDNPIAYEVNTELVEGKYYTEEGVKYLCVRALTQSVWHLADLVGNYVEVVN